LKWRVLALVTVAACNGGTDKYGTDAGADARADVTFEYDTSVDGPGGVCGPIDVTGYQPTTLVPPNPPHQNKCTSQETSDYAQCQAAKDTALCKQFADGQSGQACRQCIETQSTDPRWGVIVFFGTTSGTINVEGCVDDALAQTSKEKAGGGTGSCGDLLHASYGCQDQACAACSGDDAVTCIGEAVSGGCKSYDQAVESQTGPCSALLSDAAPPAAAACFADETITDPTQREADWLTRIVGYMCGP
jgi:hypothetical protein